MLAASTAKQTKTSRVGAVIREINKSSTGHERMGLWAGSGSLERVSQRGYRTKGECDEGVQGCCGTRGVNSRLTEQPLSI